MDLIERPDDGAERHPWETARFEFFAEILRRSGALRRAGRVLDAGAGDAWFAASLSERAPHPDYVCWDAFYRPEDVADLAARYADRPLSFAQVLPPEPVDLVLLLDVLEHVEHDATFLDDLQAVMKPGSTLLFSVPAWPALFSQHDVNLKHFRRYTPWSARALLTRHGFEVRRDGGLFHSLLLPRALTVLRERLRGRTAAAETDHDLGWNAHPWVTRTVRSALAADNALSHLSAGRLQLPGLSYWALCHRY